MGMFDGLWATDESVAEFAQADYSAIASKSLTIARGGNGVLTAASPWDLTAADSLDWAARGVVEGAVVRLRYPATAPTLDSLFGVSSVATTTLTTKRLGLDAGEGQPPGPASGADYTSVRFEVESLRPYLVNATRLLGRRFPGLAGDAATLAAEDRESLAVYWTLWQVYAAQEVQASNLATLPNSAIGGGSAGGSFAGKSKFYKAAYDELAALVNARYAATSPESGPTITPGLIRLNVAGRHSDASADG